LAGAAVSEAAAPSASAASAGEPSWESCGGGNSETPKARIHLSIQLYKLLSRFLMCFDGEGNTSYIIITKIYYI
jgi:hypothetical protein